MLYFVNESTNDATIGTKVKTTNPTMKGSRYTQAPRSRRT